MLLQWGIKQCCDLSVRPSVCLSRAVNILRLHNTNTTPTLQVEPIYWSVTVVRSRRRRRYESIRQMAASSICRRRTAVAGVISFRRAIPSLASNSAEERLLTYTIMTAHYALCLQIITRNAWQSLAYSPLGAIVSPPSEYL